MGKLAYIKRIIKGASFEKLNNVVTEVAKRTGKSKAAVLKDIIHCTKKFGSGYYDYIIFHFYELTDAQRATYITRVKNKNFQTLVNDIEYTHCFDNKNEFDVLFKDFIKRDFVDVPNASDEDIKAYFERHDDAFAKMLDLDCGRGAEVLNKSDFKDLDEIVKYVREKDFAVLEDVIKNHPDINKIYPHAVNTVRMITLIDDDGEPHLIFAAQKFGDKGRFVDVRGMHAPINLETGKVEFPFHSGETDTDIFYDTHPYTGEPLTGYTVPLWEEAKEMILKAAMVVPQMRYIGWDVAITPTGPVIIEGNNYGAYEYMQLPGQTKEKVGMLPTLKKYVKF